MTQHLNGLQIARERITHEAKARTGFLDLGQLGLTALPEELYSLQNLQHLNLGSDLLSDEGKWALAQSNISPNQIEADLRRLSKLPKLKALFLGHTNLINIAELSCLKELQTLHCSDTQVNDLSPLAGLHTLQALYCSNTQVSDLSPLAGLDALQTLHCSDTQVSDLSPLAGLHTLQALNCSRTQVSDLSPLACLDALQTLHCSGTQVCDLSPLAGLHTLQALYCSSTQVFDLSPLTGIDALQALHCSGTQVCDLSPLAGLHTLQALYCSGTQVSDLSLLTGLHTLQTLYCFSTQVSDLSPLAGLDALQTLRCSYTQVSDLSPLAGLHTLQTLYCSYTQVSDLSPLAGLHTLRAIDCSSTQVSDLSPLAGLHKLQALYCSSTQVSDLSPLAGLHTLQTLNCSSTQVNDLSPLAGLHTLQSLDCSSTQVNDLSPLADLHTLQTLDCSHCSLNHFSKKLFKNSVFDNLELILYKTKIPNIPIEVLSPSPYTVCLTSLRAHFADLKHGAIEISDAKLMVLGNGQIGKTQICRQLREEDYDNKIPSTHGIMVTSTVLQQPDSDKSSQLSLWDFGGQDIYHGTHALFMRTRAIFLLVWVNKSNPTPEHTNGGMTFRDQPLDYWLNCIKHLSGSNNPVLIVQTQCDSTEDEARYLPNVDKALLEYFLFCKPHLHYSSLKKRGHPALNEALHDALTWLQKQQGTTKIGIERQRVKSHLEKLRDTDAALPAEQRKYRTINQNHFQQLCTDGNSDISSPEHLLDYLHNTGTVFYRKGLFGDRIILDQGWALEAIYTVFHREKCYRQLQHLHGRFTRALLEVLVWNEYSKDEQMLFLSMMQSCGICFIHRKGDQAGNIDDEYIAPDLLPEKAEVSSELEEKWDPQSASEKAEFEYELHHLGLLRSFVSQIGNDAGINAVYWKNGVCIYEKNTRSRALIEQDTQGDWRGLIHLQTQGSDAKTLLIQLHEKLKNELEKWGINTPESQTEIPHNQSKLNTSEVISSKSSSLKLEFTQESLLQPEYCVSYAWGDDTPEGKERDTIVDQLCDVAKNKYNITILRDKNNLGLGENITKFMERIGTADRVFVVLSNKYLESPYCMFELFEIWRNSRLKEEEFLQRIRVFILPGTKIHTPWERSHHSIFWKTEREKLDVLIKQHGADILGEKDHRQYRLMLDFAHHVGDILATIVERLQPHNFEELVQYGLSDLSL